MCDWRTDDGASCANQDLYAVFRTRGANWLSACADHLGYLVLTPNVTWPLRIGWLPDTEQLPPNLVALNRTEIIGIVEDNPWIE
jgi:hypothetical protein